MSYVLISFETPHHTIKADKALGEIAVEKAVYPIPREISRDCGMGLRISQADLEQALRLFQERGILYKKTFPLSEKENTSLIDRFSVKDQQN